MMNILVIGNGGREHALAWKLKQSPQTDRVFVAPGNAGTAMDAENAEINELDFPSLIQFAKQNQVQLTVVGPETPLAAGIVNAFEQEKLRIFGPDKNAARLEGSKVFCKEILKKGGIPTAGYHVFTDGGAAVEYLKTVRDQQVVIKADGLAAGKGVVVCDTAEQGVEAVLRMTRDHEFGDAGHRIVIEERLHGQEASVLAVTDGSTIAVLQPAQDHKAAYDGDQGPNTGGMGAYSPVRLVDDQKLHWIEENVLVPTVHTLNRNGTPFKGVLYAGLMMTAGGPKVLEYNARFGDPECQPLLMRLQTDLADIFQFTLDRQLHRIGMLKWDERPSVCVVMASRGYPGQYEKGKVITGLEEAAKMKNVKVFHAGTKLDPHGGIVTHGGRVLGITAIADTIAEAKKTAYEAVRKIHWEGAWCRKDISDKSAAY
ncbi:MAG: phosphoribosylamine--glycine ligase [Planctomycetaceae bacterium]|jgi:phosphoribosylamine--glycine ligase|nr:phosphoribosylamine--glycine ligase [Planctomycetaceae bacterium]